METQLYDVYLTGKLAEGITPDIAAQRLAALFKSTPAAMSGLITGKPQLLKRGVDAATATKYRDAVQKAGCEVAFKAQEQARANAAPVPVSVTTATETPAPAELQLAPAGTDLLRPDERHTAPTASIDTSYLNVMPLEPFPAAEHAPVSVPDTSYLTLAAAGDNLLSENERSVPPIAIPDIGDLSIAELGAPLETLKNEAAEIHPQIDGLSLAPAGSELLNEDERKHETATAPNTDHIHLQ